MNIIKQKEELKKCILKFKSTNQSIGFVPTMGALHKGHLSLIEMSTAQCNTTIVSIFVNPAQFNNQHDLDHYPKTLEQDLEKLKTTKCDILFMPDINEMYSNTIVSESFDFNGLDVSMEGVHRKGHFNGVATILKKMFKIIEPHKTYFGKKDFQQLLIVKKMVEILKLPIQVIGCEIVREHDGLALSSRNKNLTLQERANAPFVYQVLKEVQFQFENTNIATLKSWVETQFFKKKDFKLDYFEIADNKNLTITTSKEKDKTYSAFIAVFLGNVRLIDNIVLSI